MRLEGAALNGGAAALNPEGSANTPKVGFPPRSDSTGERFTTTAGPPNSERSDRSAVTDESACPPGTPSLLIPGTEPTPIPAGGGPRVTVVDMLPVSSKRHVHRSEHVQALILLKHCQHKGLSELEPNGENLPGSRRRRNGHDTGRAGEGELLTQKNRSGHRPQTGRRLSGFNSRNRGD